MRKLVVGNWKMNGSLADINIIKDIAQTAQKNNIYTETVLCVPSVYVHHFALQKLLPIGAQDCHHLPKGAHTGDISALMLQEIGASHIIVGHSERRIDHQETDAHIHAKADAVLRSNLTPIICVGETHAHYLAGQSHQIVIEQIKHSVPITDKVFAIGYEPIWAIGTGLIPKLEEIVHIHTIIRETLIEMLGKNIAHKVHILYGGSVKPNNAHDIAQLKNVDGALVGGASLNADDFNQIIGAFSF